MKWIAVAALAGVCAFARPAAAQEVLPIGTTAPVADKVRLNLGYFRF